MLRDTLEMWVQSWLATSPSRIRLKSCFTCDENILLMSEYTVTILKEQFWQNTLVPNTIAEHCLVCDVTCSKSLLPESLH